jgi:hypothetical protein
MSRYHISAYFERDGQILDCSQGEVLGDAYGQVYPTLEEAQEAARELQDSLSETDLDPSTVYTIEPESEPMVDSDAGASAVLLRAAAGADLAECDPALELQCMMFRSVASATDAEIFDLACTVAAKASKAVELRRVLGELEAEPDDEHTRPSIEPPATIKEPATHLLRAVWGNGTSEVIPCRDGECLVIGPEGALPTTMVPRTCYGADAGVDVIVRGPEVPVVDLLKLEPDQLPLPGIPEPPVIDLESVRKVCWSLLEQAIEAVRLWPDPKAKTRIARILPVLEDGLARLAA